MGDVYEDDPLNPLKEKNNKVYNMKVSKKQQGVIAGMAGAIVISSGVICTSIVFDPLKISERISERLSVLGVSMILPTVFVIVSIGRLAQFRFFSPEDIDGSGLTSGTDESKILQSLLQNTLEQFVIAMGVYMSWCCLMPTSWLSTVPLCSILFAVGRVCFLVGYQKGAPARALGFGLTFYPTILLCFLLIVHQIVSTFLSKLR